MKTLKLVSAIESNKDLLKNMPNHFTTQEFISCANTYIKAIKSGRMMCSIKSVSTSGMSRVLSFHSFEGTISKGYYRQYYSLFKTLGYKEDNNRNGFRVNGCGMDMVFHTNYTIIHKLFKLGFINKKQCDSLCQKTPTIL